MSGAEPYRPEEGHDLALRSLPFFRGGDLDGDWREEALCRGLAAVDPDFVACFWAEEAQRQARAKQLCRECPSRLPCLEYGLLEPTGVWGGAGVRERQRLRAIRAGRPIRR